MRTAVLAIDCQVDFHDVPQATLGVPGAVKDTERIAKLIKNINPATIFASQDSHYTLDIAHTGWYRHPDGSPLSPKDYFRSVDGDTLRNGELVAIIDPVRTEKYLDDLKKDGEFPHTLWPDHCLIGTDGQSFHPVFFSALQDWIIKNSKWVNFITKGVNPFTEHFGIFRANVPLIEDPSTQVNQNIFQALNSHDLVYLVGQARTHCVANSLRQILQLAPQLASKVVVLEDCMSDVPGLPSDFYNYVDTLYKDAFSAGVRSTRSTDL